jgi:hypothetical protein
MMLPWFSDQYIEKPVLHKLAAESGLYPDLQYFKQFPDSNIEGEH